MRKYSAVNPTMPFPVPPDTVFSFLLTGGSSGQASDWLSSGSTAMTNAKAAGVNIVRVTPMTTAGGAFVASFNPFSTGATAVLSSGLSSGGSTAASMILNGPTFYQIPGNSTGFSVAAQTSGMVVVEQWSK